MAFIFSADRGYPPIASKAAERFNIQLYVPAFAGQRIARLNESKNLVGASEKALFRIARPVMAALDAAIHNKVSAFSLEWPGQARPRRRCIINATFFSQGT